MSQPLAPVSYSVLQLSFPVPLCRHGSHYGRKLKSMVEDAMKLTAGCGAALHAAALQQT